MGIEVFSFQQGQGYLGHEEGNEAKQDNAVSEKAARGSESGLFRRIGEAISGFAAVPVGLGLRPKYNWVITEDSAPHESGNRVLQHGPERASERWELARLIREGERFRLLDATGEQKLCGFIRGAFKGLEPLEDYGRQFGCTHIEYKRRNKWVRVGGA